ncbi:DUF4398 domain-containing protein [Halostella salina]|uniref:DUF4398 domain-containing protein n=1 Tax=Halostella salina TaxID=1547897 RepID=UPI000EF83F55|nr:DUF4398 domain-containing protein [Halostella salina]
MNSNRCSKLTTLLVVALVALAAVPPAAALATVEADGAPAEAEVGEEVSTTYTFTELFSGDTPQEWTLRGETNLTNATWSVTAYDNAGNQIGETQSMGGSSFEYDVVADEAVTEIEVTLTGTTPEVENYTYDPQQSFRLAEFTEVREGGGTTEIDSWETNHYTSESGDAREALDSAQEAIDEAEESGADVSEAESTFRNARQAYESAEDFDLAISLAEEAESQATEAQESTEQTEQRNTMLLYGGIGLVVLVLIGGAAYWYRQQGDDYDKLG